MGHLTETYHLTLDVASDLVRFPRVWRMSLGLLCSILAISLLCVEQAAAYWNSQQIGDRHIFSVMLLIGGAFYITQSFRNDMFRVHHISFNRTGMRLKWSHIPSLFSERDTQEKIFRWSDLQSLLWVESDHEHALKQYLTIEFNDQIGLRRNSIKLLVSDDRNLDHCEKLIAFLPENLVPPEWLEIMKRKRKSAVVHSEGFDEIPQ